MTAPESHARLLIVDDDPSLGKMLSWCFTEIGYEVSLASDGTQAEAAVKTRHFDFALLDYQLPDCDGIQLCKLLRSRQPDLRTTMMSANPPIQSGKLALRFHLKPVSINIIDDWFKASLAMHRCTNVARMQD